MIPLLKKAIESGKVSHAYIITGGSSEERYENATAFALALLGETDKEGHPDLVLITHEKDNTISIEDIRNQLIANAGVRPFRSPYQIFIMDEAEKMNEKAQNALLKTIEEPPEYVVVILLASNEQMLLETIRSRCVGIQLESSALIDENSEEYKRYLRIIKGEEEPLFDGTNDTLKFLETVRKYFHDIALSKKTATFDPSRFSFADIGRILDAVDEAETRIKFNVNPELSIKLLMMEINK